MWTGDAYRPFSRDLHFSAAWSFQIAGWRFDSTNAARARPNGQPLSAALSPKSGASLIK
jgi:hypothetical protein